ncbi:glutathione S-transferase [Pigmentiphaga aceris]|uniref:Glutathione S-transferase n=1 Tax=Pigmentiphaga aceris TaxID=1940612 RepID=A0A5C0AWA2_9BURK|nr:glutathione S-transferase [Pigmentiphaga aceris]QEI06669.1 glutathione S-transferase [Pigmentiphaga aceris]
MSEVLAAGVVTDALPVLYSFRRCPYAMRARLAIVASRQQCELREVVLRDKPAGLIAASPKATVPVLVLSNGQVIEQSLEIMRWALGRQDLEGWLPTSADDEATTDALIAECDGDFKRHLDRYKYPNRYVASVSELPDSDVPMQADAADLDGFALAHRTAGALFIASLNARLGGAGRFLLGERWSLADAAILPFIRQFAATDPAWFDAQPWVAVQAWLHAFVESPRYLAVMDKYPQWQDGTPGLRFPG